MHKKFILLLGIVLGSFGPAAAQTTPAPGAVLTQGRPSTMAAFRAPANYSLRTAFLSAPLFATPFARFSPLVMNSYEPDPSLSRLLPSENDETLFASEWRVPVVRLWKGRLQVDAFQSTLRMDDIMFGPSPRGSLRDFGPPRLGQLRAPRSIDRYGVSLAFHLSRDAQTGRVIQLSRLARIVGIDLPESRKQHH